MRRGLFWAPAIGLALAVVGCNSSVPAVYSPSGNALASGSQNSANIWTAGRSVVIGSARPNSFAWSPDGAELAWTSGAESDTTTKGQRTITHESTHIYDLAMGKTVTVDDVGGAVCWFMGDLVAIDNRSPKPKLATIDPPSGQVRYEVDCPQSVFWMAPTGNVREVIVETGTGMFRFDGLRFSEVDGQGVVPIAGGSGAVLFADEGDAFVSGPWFRAEEPQSIFIWRASVLRKLGSVSKSDWSGVWHAGSLGWHVLGASQDLRRIIVFAHGSCGSVADERELDRIEVAGLNESFAHMFDSKKPKVKPTAKEKRVAAAEARRFNALGRRLHEESVCLLRQDGKWRIVFRQNGAVEWTQAVDPALKHLALVDDGGKVKTIDIP